MKIKNSIMILLFLISFGKAYGYTNDGDAFFYAVSDLTYQKSSIPTLIGGRPADPSDWPASFYSISSGGSCTSTLVGPRALFTAAHCVGNGKKVSIEKAREVFQGTCTHAKEYATNQTADYALCIMNRNVPAAKYERINVDSDQLKVGGQLLLTGFGCTRAGGGGGNDGVYRIGKASIQVLPAGTNNDIVTKGEVALCFGDSGGPAFILYADKENGARAQVSINSRGNIFNTSYLSSLSTKMAVDFISNWSKANKAEICGFNLKASICHD